MKADRDTKLKKQILTQIDEDIRMRSITTSIEYILGKNLNLSITFLLDDGEKTKVDLLVGIVNESDVVVRRNYNKATGIQEHSIEFWESLLAEINSSDEMNGLVIPKTVKCSNIVSVGLMLTEEEKVVIYQSNKHSTSIGRKVKPILH